jgi:hypothetical protein
VRVFDKSRGLPEGGICPEEGWYPVWLKRMSPQYERAFCIRRDGEQHQTGSGARGCKVWFHGKGDLEVILCEIVLFFSVTEHTI